MTSKLITLSADGSTATVTDATIMDIVTTSVSQTKKVTGLYGLFQSIGLVAIGMSAEAKIRANTFKPALIGG